MAPQRKQPAGAKALTGSDEAKRKAAVFLEAIGGLRTTQSASEELGIALVRYYVLETRMLQAMIDALEPKARGRQRTVDMELAQLRDDRLRDMERQILLRDTKIELTEALLEGREVDQKGGAITRQERRKIEREVRKRRRG